MNVSSLLEAANRGDDFRPTHGNRVDEEQLVTEKTEKVASCFRVPPGAD
jgi:hypothetical protein